MSSGQNVTTTLDLLACKCGWAGIEELFIDPELHTEFWTCPQCDTDHEQPIRRSA